MDQSRFITVFSSDPARLFEIAPQLSPYVEVFQPDGIIIKFPTRYEQDTLNRLSHLVPKNIQIGGASTRTLAVFVAKANPGTLLPFGREESFLASLPLHLLNLFQEVGPDVFGTLSDWGIETMGELAALPRAELVARLGPQGETLQRIARGEDIQSLDEYRPETSFEESKCLDWTLDTLEPLFFILGEMLESLTSRLKGRGLAAEEVELSLGLTDDSLFEKKVRLAFPMQDPKVILSLIRLELQSCSPPAGVAKVSLQIKPARPRIFQHSLLQPSAPHPEKFSQILNRLKTLVGTENVGCPRILNTHRPDTFQIREPSIQCIKTPPRLKSEKKPEEKSTTERQSFYASISLSMRRMRPPRPLKIRNEEILSCAGPWRSSGDWWREGGKRDEWSREEWDVELSSGGIYRIFWDHDEKEWFLEGIYD